MPRVPVSRVFSSMVYPNGHTTFVATPGGGILDQMGVGMAMTRREMRQLFGAAAVSGGRLSG